MKKVLAMLLCTLLLVGFVFPAYATENSETQETTEATTAPTETQEETKSTETTVTETSEPTEPVVPETSEPTDPVVPDTSVPSEPAVSEPAVKETTPEAPAPTEEPKHIEGCGDDCTGEDCECGCHVLSLFDRIMACETLEEIDAIFSEITEEEYAALTDEEIQEIDTYIDALEPDPLPAVVLEVSDPPVPSEIVTQTVNYDYVAPLVDSN